MRHAALLLIAVALAACNLQSPPPPSPTPISPAKSQAADLRTHLDLLLGEQVMIAAKESAAAVNHSDEYMAYTSLLATNSSDLTGIVSRAYGNTAGVQFTQAWNAQNGFLVDYAIGVVTHDADRSRAAMDGLSGKWVAQFSQLIAGMSRLPLEPVTQLVSTQVTQDKAFIDDLSAGKLIAYYADLHRGYVQTSRLGDALAQQIVSQFPDRYPPGDASAKPVDVRVTLNLDLQEHSYLATMATDATVNGRDGERAQALSAISVTDDALRSLVEDARFSLAFTQEAGALVDYALRGDATSRQALTQTFVTELAGVTGSPSGVIVTHANASIKVVDDQRSKAGSIAADDRAAATSVQPIADSTIG